MPAAEVVGGPAVAGLADLPRLALRLRRGLGHDVPLVGLVTESSISEPSLECWMPS